MTAHLDARIVQRPAPGPWVRDAKCRGVDSTLFYSAEKGRDAQVAAAKAKAVCATCPVQAECLDHAITHSEPFGVWGGMTVAERRKIRPPAFCLECGTQLSPRTRNRLCSDACRRRRHNRQAAISKLGGVR